MAFCFSFARKNICLKLKAAEPAKGTNPRHFLSPSVLTTTAASANTASDYSPLKSDDNSIVSGDEALAFDDEALSTLSSDRELQSDLLSITSSLHHEQQDTDAWVKKITDPFFSSLPEAEYQANIKFIQKLTRKYEATSKNYL